MVGEEEKKKLADVKLADDISIEEIRAIREILTKAGLIVEIEDRHLLFILAKVE